MVIKMGQSNYQVVTGEPVEIKYSITNDWPVAFSSNYKIELIPYCNFYGTNNFYITSGNVISGETKTGSFKLNTMQNEKSCSFQVKVKSNRLSDGKEISVSYANFTIITKFKLPPVCPTPTCTFVIF